MSSLYGQIVRHVKPPHPPDTTARDFADSLSIITSMKGKKPSGRSLYKVEFCARVRKLREAKGWTQAQMAHAMQVTEEAWRKYETRSPLPHDMVERFALIVGRSVSYIMTGKELPDTAGRGRPFREAL